MLNQQAPKRRETEKRNKMCTNKKTFGTYRRALDYAKMIRKKLNNNCRVYECPICDKFHTTSKKY